MSEDWILEAHSSKQEQAIYSNYKITALITGIQWGKTTSGAAWLRRIVADNLTPDASFIVTAPTYKIMDQSTMPAFKREMNGFGSFKGAMAYFEVEAGLGNRNPKIYFRTAKEPDAIVGITNVFGIWGDEAGKYSLYFWENIQGRASFKDCPIILTTSPYAMNWIYKELIKPARAGQRDDVLLIQAASNENSYFPDHVYQHKKMTMDPRRFNMMYNGNFDKMQGLVYGCFDEKENQCEAFKLPDGTKYYGGIDWGYTEPFVLKVRAITITGQHYSVSEFYKSGLTPSEIIQVCKQKKEVFGIKHFYADPSQPGLIEELCRNGVPASAADNDISRGVGMHYELLATRRLKYFKDQNPKTLDELETYHYPEPEDLGPDDDAKDQTPVGQDDHALDADRYVTISTYNLTKQHKVIAPEEKDQELTQVARLKKLMKRKSSSQSEDWS